MAYRKPKGRLAAKRATAQEPQLPVRTRAIPPDPRDDIWSESTSRSRKKSKNKKVRRTEREFKARRNPMAHWSSFPPGFLEPYVPQYEGGGYYAKNNGRAYDPMRDLYTPETFPYGAKATSNPVKDDVLERILSEGKLKKDQLFALGNKQLVQVINLSLAAGETAKAAEYAMQELARRAKKGSKNAVSAWDDIDFSQVNRRGLDLNAIRARANSWRPLRDLSIHELLEAAQAFHDVEPLRTDDLAIERYDGVPAVLAVTSWGYKVTPVHAAIAYDGSWVLDGRHGFAAVKIERGATVLYLIVDPTTTWMVEAGVDKTRLPPEVKAFLEANGVSTRGLRTLIHIPHPVDYTVHHNGRARKNGRWDDLKRSVRVPQEREVHSLDDFVPGAINRWPARRELSAEEETEQYKRYWREYMDDIRRQMREASARRDYEALSRLEDAMTMAAERLAARPPLLPRARRNGVRPTGTRPGQLARGAAELLAGHRLNREAMRKLMKDYNTPSLVKAARLALYGLDDAWGSNEISAEVWDQLTKMTKQAVRSQVHQLPEELDPYVQRGLRIIGY